MSLSFASFLVLCSSFHRRVVLTAYGLQIAEAAGLKVDAQDRITTAELVSLFKVKENMDGTSASYSQYVMVFNSGDDVMGFVFFVCLIWRVTM